MSTATVGEIYNYRQATPDLATSGQPREEQLPAIAANRGLEPKKLRGLVRGDLDWIVMKCLEKERARRYDTANGLAQDLQRYLADEPVLASPPSARYRMRKFVRKHKGGVIAAARINLETEIFHAVRDFLAENLHASFHVDVFVVTFVGLG